MNTKLPVVYVRGFAGGERGIDKQVDDPFYGFNAGSTHIRVGGDDAPQFYSFESPLLRLFSEEGYQPLSCGDQRAYLESRDAKSVPAETVWIYRFYDASANTFGKEPVDFDIEQAAAGLYDFIELVRSGTGAPKVYLVAHSMGGLVCRSMIQKISYLPKDDGQPRTPAKELVDKLFTYGTPHGGISFEAGSGLIDWAMETFGPAGADIFSPPKMYGYLNRTARWGDEPPDDTWHPNKIPEDEFPADRVFCLIGTDSTDYGIVEKIVGPRSDGLVQIDNAYVQGAHRAYTHRSHSGRYGMVNSEEGYQNLRRFLFGAHQVDVGLSGLQLPQPKPDEKEVWQAEVRLSVRGLPVVMHERLAAHHCPIQLNDEQERQHLAPGSPVPLTTVFLLDPARFSGDPLGKPPLRCRYALHLRVFRLVEKHGHFFWQDHLEQTADWDDILIVDIGRRDGEPEGAMHAWTAWNSDLDKAIADKDPVSDTAERLADGTVTVELPPAAGFLGDQASLVLDVSPWN